MKKILFALILLLFLISNVLAVQINMPSEFKQKQTLIAKISGDFYDSLSEENILLYREHVRIPFSFELAKIQGDYYIYSRLDKQPGNYSLSVENVRYFKNNTLIEDTIEKGFFIKNQTADFSINPGVIYTDNNFSITIQNLQDKEISVDLETSLTNKNSITLSPKSSEEINFDISSLEETNFEKVNFTSGNLSYEVPVYIVILEETSDNILEKKSMIFSPVDFEIKLATNYSAKKIIYLYNNGNVDLENIELEVSDSLKNYVSLNSGVSNLDADKSAQIILNISSGSLEKSLQGQITANSENIYAYSSLSLKFVKNYVPSEKENKTEIVPDPVTLDFCSEMNGEICSENEKCSGEEDYARDGICCLGSCIEKEKSSTGKIIGWIFIGIAVILLILFFLKYKKVKNPVDLLKIARGKK